MQRTRTGRVVEQCEEGAPKRRRLLKQVAQQHAFRRFHARLADDRSQRLRRHEQVLQL